MLKVIANEVLPDQDGVGINPIQTGGMGGGAIFFGGGGYFLFVLDSFQGVLVKFRNPRWWTNMADG